jgi:glutaredoxin 3
MSQAKVKVYTTPTCPWCQRVKEYFKQKKVKFEEVNVAEDEKARNDLVEKSGQMGVPVIEIEKGDEEPVIIVGFDQEALQEALGLAA